MLTYNLFLLSETLQQNPAGAKGQMSAKNMGLIACFYLNKY